MSGATEPLRLDPANFKLKDYDNIRITMPEKPAMSEEDVDAQLFEYVLSSGKNIKSIADLDDEWVRAHFDGLETVADVRQAIVDQYDRELEYEYSDLKVKTCIDALLDRLEGDVPEDVLQSNIDTMRSANEQRLDAMHISMEQFLRESHMTPDQYEEKLRNETLYQLRLNMALDLMVDVLGMQVGNHELTEYLQTPNPEAFLEEIREKGQVENARQAAARVKAMRRIVDTAIVNGKMPGKQPDEPNKPPAQPVVVDDADVPDLKHPPAPQIRDDQAGKYTFVSTIER